MVVLDFVVVGVTSAGAEGLYFFPSTQFSNNTRGCSTL